MEPARAEARSEWLEFDGNANAVHRAVASARSLETGAVPLRHEQDTLVNLDPLDSGHLSCTQLLLRKGHDGNWNIFLDGRLETTAAEAAAEEAEGRRSRGCTRRGCTQIPDARPLPSAL